LWDTLMDGICRKTARSNFQKRSPKICAPLERVRLCLVFLQRDDVQSMVKLALEMREKEAIGTLMEYANSALRILRPSSIPVDTQLEEIEHDLRAVISRNRTSEVLFHRKNGAQRTQLPDSIHGKVAQEASSGKSGSLREVPHNKDTASPVRALKYTCSREFDEIYASLQDFEKSGKTPSDANTIRPVNEQLKAALYGEHQNQNDFTLLRHLVAESNVYGVTRNLSSFDVFDVLENSVLKEHAINVLDGLSIDTVAVRKTCDEISAVRDTWRNLRSNEAKKAIGELRCALPSANSDCTIAHVNSTANRLFCLLSKGRVTSLKELFSKDHKPSNLPILDEIAICLRFLNNDIIQNLCSGLTEEESRYLVKLKTIGAMVLRTIEGPAEAGFKKLNELRDLLDGIPQNNPFPKHQNPERFYVCPGEDIPAMNSSPRDDIMDTSDDESDGGCDGTTLKEREPQNKGEGIDVYVESTCDSLCSQKPRRNEDDTLFRTRGEKYGKLHFSLR